MATPAGPNWDEVLKEVQQHSVGQAAAHTFGGGWRGALHQVASAADRGETAAGEAFLRTINPVNIVSGAASTANKLFYNPMEALGDVTGLGPAARGAREIVNDPSSLRRPISTEEVGSSIGGGVGAAALAAIGKEGVSTPEVEPLATRLYRASLKPLGTAKEGAIKARTLLEEGISPIGETKAWKKISDYANQVQQRLTSISGETINPEDVLKEVDPLLRTEAQGGKPGESFNVQVAPSSDVSSVGNTIQDFVKKHFLPAIPSKPTGILDASGNRIMTEAVPPQPVPIPILEGQAEKQGTYQMLNKKAFGTGQIAKEAVPAGSEQTQYALARGLRRQIGEKAAANGINDVHSISAMEGRLLDVMPELQRNAAQFANSGAMSLRHLAGLNLVRAYGAMGLYKAGKLAPAEYGNILRNAMKSASVVEAGQQGPTGGPVEEGGTRAQ